MEASQHVEVRSEHPVEDDWDRAAEPALPRAAPHSEEITNQHRGRVGVREPEHGLAEVRFRGRPESAAREVRVDPGHQAEDRELNGEQETVGRQVPLLVRR